jgi:hypothetical protein|tara:strand:- start:659 stop:874 length:216 start_codon:yes stop_codon:yes gene_type:complete
MPYYISKVKLATDGPKGSVKWITENYLVNAVSITHAESLVNEDFKDSGLEFEVKSVAESRIIKIIGNTKKL